mmetsp:Transcript_34297/g.75018  ORF Transcript_34297/g.75018 Transcript_34297/m.75018 type:complete len:84 (-) Transcript_34297:6-257(-)
MGICHWGVDLGCGTLISDTIYRSSPAAVCEVDDDFPMLGVTLAFLADFRRHHKKRISIERLTTEQVCTTIVKPLTQVQACSCV